MGHYRCRQDLVMEPNAAPAAQPVSRLEVLERAIQDLQAKADNWMKKADAARTGSQAEQRYLQAYSELNAQLLELQKQKGALLQREAAPPASQTVLAKTIKIYDPLQDPELYDVTFFSEAKFDSWLGRGFITGLFKEGQAPAIIYYDDLEDNALYTLEMCSGIPTRIKSMEKAMSHLGSRREVELALAIAQDCGPSATVRPDLRIIKDSAGKHIAELDAVVDYDDAFIIGSHKTKVAGDSDIKNLRRKVDEIVVHHPPFQGKRIELAFMTEHADEGAKQRLRDTAKVYNVRLFERNGRAISRVNCSRGMQGCRLI